MDELTSILLSTGLAFVGTIIGATVSWFATKKSNATAATLRLYEEWNSESMLVARHEVQEVQVLFDRNKETNLDAIFHLIDPKHRAQIWKIIHFYEKLYVMLDNNQCNNKLIPALFGEHFYWWYLHCFEAKLLPSENRISSVRIRNFKNWLDRHASGNDISRWTKRAWKTTKVFSKQTMNKLSS
ncbi:MAG: hypothetical protein GXO35_04460 [Gammaproteobacteria bacterium]|nr:hypothetical protein [Gammaproteobacteria bacterium]